MYYTGKEYLIVQQAYDAVGDELPEASDAADLSVLLMATGLKMAFGGQVILDNVNLELKAGEVVLLRGENGSGKTTLLNILTGNLEPDAGAIHYLADGSPRTYRFPRRWWHELNPFDHFAPEFVVREGIGRTWQDVRLFGSQSLRDNIAVAEPGHPGENPILALISPNPSARREDDINRDADAMLARFGLAGREDSSADKISLGQSKRVAIARAVAAGAKVLFLDEPLAGLDRQGITEVLSLLEELVKKNRLTLIIVEHIYNHPHLHGLVTTHWLLEKGKLKLNNCVSISQGDECHSDESAQKRPEWFHLLASSDDEIIDEPLPRGALITRIRRPGIFKTPPIPTLELRDLVVKRGTRTVIGLDADGNQSGFSLTLYEGEIAILQAPNGWGKSTLLAAICGLIKLDKGEIIQNGQSLNSLSVWDRVKKGISALPSNQHSFPNLSAEEVLTLAGNKSVISDLGYLSGRVCSSLSGGEIQTVGLKAQIENGLCPTVRIFDEPFAALDLTHATDTIKQISKSCGVTDFLLLPYASS